MTQAKPKKRMLKFSFPFTLPPLSLFMFHLVLPSPSSRRGPPPPLQPSQANVEPRPPHSSQICSSHPGNPQNSIATPRAARGTRSGAHPPPLHRNSRGGDASCLGARSLPRDRRRGRGGTRANRAVRRGESRVLAMPAAS